MQPQSCIRAFRFAATTSGAFLALSLIVPAEGQSTDQNAILMQDGFESADGHIANRPLRLRTGWRESIPGISKVTTDQAESGRRSLAITSDSPDAFVSKTFPLSPDGITFVDLRIRPVADATDAPVAQLDVNGSVIGFVRDGEGGLVVTISSGARGEDTTDITKVRFSISESNEALDWLRLTVRQDVTASTWDMFIDGLPIALDLSLPSSDRTKIGIGQIRFYATLPGISFIDEV